MAVSACEKGGIAISGHVEPVCQSGSSPAADLEKRNADKVTQNDIIIDSSDTANDTDSSGGLERWNGSRNNTARYLVVNLALFIMGMNDACIGVSAP